MTTKKREDNFIIRYPQAREFTQRWFAYDCEWDSDGRLIALCVITSDGDRRVVVGRPVGKEAVLDVFSWLARGGYRDGWAHWGNRFDWRRLFRYGKLIDAIDFSGSNGAAVLTLELAGERFTFYDLARYYATSLEKVANAFSLSKVGEGKEAATYDDETLATYVEADTTIVWHAVKQLESWSREDALARIPATAASFALKHYLRWRERRGMRPLKRLNKHEDSFITRAYHGGLVLAVEPGVYDNVRFYDVNSMYPSVMRDVVIAVDGYFRVRDGAQLYDIVETCVAGGHIFFVEAEWVQERRDVPPFLIDEATKRASYVGRGVISAWELLHWKRNSLGRITLGEALYPRFRRALPEWPFRDYIDDLYAARLAAKERGDEATERLLKLLMNSLYGKFGERGVGKKLAVLDETTKDLYFAPEGTPLEERATYLGRCGGIDYLLVPGPVRHVPHRRVDICAQVTALARCRLHQAWIDNVRAGNTVLYCDTDSMALIGEPVFPVGNALGEWKLEKEGRLYLGGPKLYAMTDDAGRVVKAAHKGFPRRVRVEGEDTDTAKIVISCVLWNRAVVVSFESATTNREFVARGCDDVERVRTMRPITSAWVGERCPT